MKKFTNFKCVTELDTFDAGVPVLQLPAMRKRSKIVELVVAEDLIFGLNQSGVCMAFDRQTKKRLCVLNTSCDEIIRSLFHAKCGRSRLITVSVYRDDNFSSLQCSTTTLEDIRKGRPDRSRPIFQSELLRWPGFVEFDDVNSKVLTYDAKDRKYKVWSLTDYRFMYEMNEPNIEEIKISPGIMLVIFTKSEDQRRIPLQIRDIETGAVLQEFEHELNPRKEIEFIEQFNEKLLVKQQDGPLQIMDVRAMGSKVGDEDDNMRSVPLISIPCDAFKTPKAFIFLYENQLFLTFRRCTVGVWNFRGHKVTEFEDHQLYNQETNTNSIYINTHQDLIISYCRSSRTNTSSISNRRRRVGPRDGEGATVSWFDDREDNRMGAIHVSHILSGKCFARIAPEDPLSRKALSGITALFYSEETNEIFTGNSRGLINCWAS